MENWIFWEISFWYAARIFQVEERIQALVNAGKVKADKVALNLTELGFEKLLGSGKIAHKVSITVELASAKAVEKITAAGGEVILPSAE